MNLTITPTAIIAQQVAFSSFTRQIELMYQVSEAVPVDMSLTVQGPHFELVCNYAGNKVIRKRYQVINGRLNLTFTGTVDYFTLADWGLQRSLSEQIEKLLALGMTAFTVTF